MNERVTRAWPISLYGGFRHGMYLCVFKAPRSAFFSGGRLLSLEVLNTCSFLSQRHTFSTLKYCAAAFFSNGTISVHS